MSEINRWSTTAGGALQNASGYFPEGQAPSTVNDAARTIMAEIKRQHQVQNAQKTATYATQGYSVTFDREVTAGERAGIWTFIADEANHSGSATLNINALGAKDLRWPAGHLETSDIDAKQICVAAYNPTGDYYELLNRGSDERSPVLRPAQATTSGNTITFSSIPAWATEINVMLSAVSLNGNTDGINLRIGDSGGLETSGYTGGARNFDGSTLAAFSGAFNVTATAASAALAWTGVLTLRLAVLSTNTWAYSGQAAVNSNGSVHDGTGFKSLTGTLTQVALLVSGTPTDAFDGGSVSLSYR